MNTPARTRLLLEEFRKLAGKRSGKGAKLQLLTELNALLPASHQINSTVTIWSFLKKDGPENISSESAFAIQEWIQLQSK